MAKESQKQHLARYNWADRPKIEFKVACDVMEFAEFGKIYGFYDVTGYSHKKWLCVSDEYLWHWQSRFVPIQTTTVSVEITIIFCGLYYFFVIITIFLVVVTKWKLSYENGNFDKDIFLHWTRFTGDRLIAWSCGCWLRHFFSSFWWLPR